ncbi:hypothetical protein BLNAU_22141 [Blattamonas nauphoetae]|uniref:Uncharacterized protein n=1 Tax=Blattamonas nauphoetae TaxID=2049346 RepID=A0ABQ9WTV9_9EUKA|nr:hypothetical protein BLNAU_22141 [Blattamonas nauphoetae]
MKKSSNSAKTRSKRPFSRDIPPLFLSTDPKTFQTINEASLSFQSLVDFIKEGHDLNYRATTQACTLLEGISPHYDSEFTSEQVLSELVPTPDGSCSGFTQSIVLLLTSSNEELVNASISLLAGILYRSRTPCRFDFLASGFFSLLPKAFYEQEMHLSDKHGSFLMDTAMWFLFCSRPETSRTICQSKRISTSTFQQTFINKFFHPIEPFLNFVCRNRRDITDSENELKFTLLLASAV